MRFIDLFREEYKSKLLKPNGNNPVRDRASGFDKIFDMLDGSDYKIVVETGCMRPDHGLFCYGDDGCSTVLFDHFIRTVDGEFWSVDINLENVYHSRKFVSEKSRIEHSDSVNFLYNLKHKIPFITLLYLDSYDFNPGDQMPSQIHHLKELCAAFPLLKKGSIVVVDDHILPDGTIGKGKLIEDFMENIEAELIHKGYQLIYRIND